MGFVLDMILHKKNRKLFVAISIFALFAISLNFSLFNGNFTINNKQEARELNSKYEKSDK